MIPEAAVEAAMAAIWDLPITSTEFEWQREMVARAALEAAAPHMQPDLLEEWAVQFASGAVEEAEDSNHAHRKLYEIREAIVDGIETPALEPMQIVHRYRVASSELTSWKVATP